MLREFDEDTIVAVSTPPGEGALGVVRLSGPAAIPIADRMFVSGAGKRVRDQKSFSVQRGRIASEEAGRRRVLDEVLLLVMRAPKSYTCEDVVEISAHGGTAVLRAIVELAVREGARLAARGEFTKRAFLNGRIDLVQAEAVLELIQAKTETGRQWAAEALDGGLTQKIRSVKEALIGVLSHLEALIDFPEDFPDPDSAGKMAERLSGLAAELTAILDRSRVRLIARQGLRLVLAGRPNVGKSSLMNRLAGENRVIVSAYPGTTRDIVHEEIEMNGIPVHLTDTAGIQETNHPVDQDGIARSKEAVRKCDLLLYVLDVSREWSAEDARLLGDLGPKKKILVLNKSDLPACWSRTRLEPYVNGGCVVESSCVTDGGTRSVEDAIYRSLTGGAVAPDGEVMVSTVRQRENLENGVRFLEAARVSCLDGASPEFTAAEVRSALDSLGRLVGEVVTDDVLEALFGRFCIGK